MMKTFKGTILKGIGGFYYVESLSKELFECKARGIFRKEKMKPVAGDKVIVQVQKEGYLLITEILPRKNYLIRPPIANLDVLVIIASIKEPILNTLLIDQMILVSEINKIEPILYISKSDLGNTDEMKEIYKKANIKVALTPENLESLIFKKFTAFVGNSGVGKTTLLNKILPNLHLKTNMISSKLGRGKHTTREVELFEFCDGYIADTPGFSSIDISRNLKISKEDIQYGFREFSDYSRYCKYNSCVHINENDCAIKNAVNSGEISKSRYDNYVLMYEKFRTYELKKY